MTHAATMGAIQEAVAKRPIPPRIRRIHYPWDLMLLALTVYVFAAVGRVHQLFPALDLARPALVGSLGAIALVCSDRSRITGTWNALRTTTGRLLLGFGLWTALSLVTSIYQGNTVTVIEGFAKTLVMCAVIAGAPRTARDAERLAFAYYACAVLYAFIILARFHVGGDVTRLAGLYYYDANDFAVLAVTAIPLGFHFVVTPRPYWQRASGVAGIPALITAVVWSGSRGGFLALLLVTLCVVLGSGTLRLHWRIVGVGAVVLGLGISAGDSYWKRMTTIVHPDNDYNETSDSGRLKVWKRGLVYMRDRPFLGVGAGNFPVAEGTLSPLADRQDFGVGVKWSVAHNSYVQIGAELGVPGLVLFLGMLVAAVRGLGRVRRLAIAGVIPEGERSARLARTIQIAIAGFAVGGFFLSLGFSEMLYTLIALAIGMRRVGRPLRWTPSPQPSSAGAAEAAC